MQTTASPEDALGFLDILDDFSIEYALVGGVAVGCWSKERFTKDIDFTVALTVEGWAQLKSYLSSSSDVIVDLIAIDKDVEPNLPYLVRIQFRKKPIDLIVSLTDYQRSLLKRKVSIEYLGKKIFIASPEDIIVSKLIANRSQDLVDIETLLAHLTNLDFNYIEKWAKEWEVSELWNRVVRKK